MYQTNEPDLDDTLARLDKVIEEFHRLRDTARSSDQTSWESAEQENAVAEPSLVSLMGRGSILVDPQPI